MPIGKFQGMLHCKTGKWVKAPGEKLIQSVEKHLGKMPILPKILELLLNL